MENLRPYGVCMEVVTIGKTSEETKRKISEYLKGKHKGKHWRLENGKRVWY